MAFFFGPPTRCRNRFAPSNAAYNCDLAVFIAGAAAAFLAVFIALTAVGMVINGKGAKHVEP